MKKIGRLHDICYRMRAEIQGAEIKEEWTPEEREAARKAYYSQEELGELERAKK